MKISKFIESISGLSDNTRRNYEATLWQLHSIIKDDEPTSDEIHSFLKRYTTSSLQRHQAAIKAYLEFIGQPWPFTRRQFSLKKQRIPRYVSPQVVQEIIDSADNEDENMFLRTLYTLGCRISELRSITRERINSAGVRVVTKGGNEYLKVTTKAFNNELTKYAGKKKNGAVFPHTYTYYNKLLKKMAKRAGHDEISLHMIRHGRAVDLLRKGMDISDVKQFLNHANINTTMIYLEITGGELAEQLEKAESNGTDS